MRITYGSYTQTCRYIKEGGKVLSIGEATPEQQIVVYRDKDGIECKINILSPHVKNVVIVIK